MIYQSADGAVRPGIRLVMVALAVGLAGCFSWRPFEPAAPLSPASRLSYRLRATLTDSSRVELTSPFVRGDTLYGRTGPRRDTLGVAVGAVRQLERQRLSVWRTLGLVVGVPAAALIGTYVVVCGDGDCNPDF